MNYKIKSNPISNSVDGINFEHSVQAFFVVQMMLGGMTPRMRNCRITNVILQSERYGRKTDDCEIILKGDNGEKRSLLVQIKRNFKLGEKNNEFTETVRDAWMDFSDEQKFNKAFDKIMLVAGGLDQNGDGLRRMLTHMQSSYNSSSQFWEDYNNELTGRSKCELKGFERLINKLKEVNGGTALDDSTIFDFCKSFFIVKSDMHEGSFYNGDINIALTHSMLASRKWKNNKSPEEVWARLYVYISGLNKNQVNLCVDKPLAELKAIFKENNIVYQQNKVSDTDTLNSVLKSGVAEKNIKTEYKKELALLCMIGGYDSSNSNDKKIIAKAFNEDYETLQNKIQSICNSDGEDLKLKNAIWKVIDPKLTIRKLSNYIYDSDVENFKKIYLEVLSEVDPALDLPVDKRYMASIYGKKRKYSQSLRNGVANGMAMIANNQDMFKQCSVLKIDGISTSTIAQLLKDYKNSRMWASIEEEASLIAQTAPKEFLKIFGKTLLISKNNPFRLLSEEDRGDVFFEKDYMSGLRWALADLAWNEETFSQACLALGKLSTYEPARSDQQNRALETILYTILPWQPQTLANIEVRYRIVDKIVKKHRKNGRKLLKNLLPNVTQVSVERQIPKWNNSLFNKPISKSIKIQEFWDQSSYYARLFIETAKSTEEMIDAIRSSEYLTDDAFTNLIEKINKKIKSVDDKEKRIIWNNLLEEIDNLDQYSGAENSLMQNRAKKFQKIADRIGPEENIEKYSYLFNKYDHELVHGPNWSLDRKEIKQKREKILSEILQSGDMEKLYELIETARLPYIIGSTLSSMDDPSLNDKVLHDFINRNGFSKEFVLAFVYGRYYYYNQDTEWLYKAGFDDWSDEQKVLVLICLPFKKDIWDLLDKQNKGIVKAYWEKVNDFRSIQEEGYSEYAVNRLLQVKRPLAAVECIYWSLPMRENDKIKTKLNDSQCIKALIKSANSPEDKSMLSRLYGDILKIFDYLHKNSNFIETNLWEAELLYLPLFSRYGNHTRPLALMYLVANNAEFFCSLIKMAYVSNKSQARKIKKISEQLQKNLLSILSFNVFPIMPGLDQNMRFNANKFKSWINETEKECKKVVILT